MDKLWAPWRTGYILGQKKKKKCFICQITKSKRDKSHFIIGRSLHSLAVLNIYPYNNGHVMITPYRHVKKLSLLRPQEQADLWALVNQVTEKIEKKMKPHGMNIGMNIGAVSGAGLPGHIHVHVVPRWKGDANFMVVTGNTKVISESLRASFNKLRMNIKK